MGDKVNLNPWLSIWVRPKQTIRQIVDYNSNFRLFFLSFFYGLVSLLSLSQSMSAGNVINVFLMFIICIIFAPLWGYLVFSFSSFFIYYTGKWLKGEAKYNEIRAAIAWSNVPMMGNLLLWIIMIGFFGSIVFKNFPADYPLLSSQTAVLFAILFLQLILSIWVLVLYINTLAEVQKFSIAKSIINIIIAVVIFIAIFMIVSFLYHFVFRLIQGS